MIGDVVWERNEWGVFCVMHIIWSLCWWGRRIYLVCMRWMGKRWLCLTRAEWVGILMLYITNLNQHLPHSYIIFPSFILHPFSTFFLCSVYQFQHYGLNKPYKHNNILFITSPFIQPKPNILPPTFLSLKHRSNDSSN